MCAFTRIVYQRYWKCVLYNLCVLFLQTENAVHPHYTSGTQLVDPLILLASSVYVDVLLPVGLKVTM